MPLLRFEVRNEYGLGDPELYKGAVKKEDPKELLDGVSVAGLVGILRQLGDVAEFAADIFHDLHEQVTTTSLRGRKMMKRIQNIEAALPLVEKAIKEQKTHIHFSYVAGSDWHVKIQDEQNHLLSSELPRFMMDSYEECRDPPRLYLLDKFDLGGTGACLKRYSDPSYFKRVWAASQLRKSENGPREKKKLKRKGSHLRNQEVLSAMYIPRHDGSRTTFTSHSMDEQSFSTENLSVVDMKLNPELSHRSTSFCSTTKESHEEDVIDENPPVFPELELNKLPNTILHCKDGGVSATFHLDELSTDDLDDASQHHSAQEHSVPRPPSVTWDNETEMVKSPIPVSCEDILVDKVEDSNPLQMHSGPQIIDHSKIEIDASNQEEVVLDVHKVSVSSVVNHIDEMNSETDNYMDALNTMESETETETECQTKCEVKSLPDFNSHGRAPETVNKSMDCPDSPEVKVSNMSSNSSSEDAAGRFPNVGVSDGSIHAKSIQHTDFIHHKKNTAVNDASESSNLMPVERKASERFHKSPSPELHSSSLHLTMNDGVAPVTSVSKHSPSDTLCLPSVQLWTNGGLFGVEPSKPPDLGTLNISKQNVAPCLNSASDFSTYMGKNQQLSNDTAKSGTVVRESEATTKNANFVEKADGKCASSDSSSHSYSNGDQLSRRAHDVVPSIDPLKESSLNYPNYSDDMNAKQERQVSLQRPLSLTTFNKTREVFRVGLDASSSEAIITKNSLINSSSILDFINHNSQNKGSGQSIKSMSSSFSDLAQRFLANTLQRKPSMGNGNISGHYGVTCDGVRKLGETSKPNSHAEPSLGVASQASCALDTKEKATHEPLKRSTSFSSHYSEQSSPPLEHMKISFHPMNGSEMSKVDFSTGSFHEKNEDFIFPSFHLHQDHVDHLADNVSGSDDDTFCRSCPYSSDDLLSPRSFTNSDMWEPDEECMNHELCDASHGVSSKTFISGHEQKKPVTVDTLNGHRNINLKDGGITFQSESFVDLPGLDSLISSINKQEGIFGSSHDPVNSEVLSKDQPPPPLPPVQWRIMKALVMSEDNSCSDNHLGTSQASRFPLPLQQGLQSPKPSCGIQQEQQEWNYQENPNHCVTDKEASLMEELLHQITNKNQQLAWDNVNGQGKPKICATNTKEPDEREELLHQIRNKSFNLRRTAAPSASNLQRSSTNVANVSFTAILEKATAIRQACVGSDEGGDDNWSDG